LKVRDTVGKVAISLKIMPETPDTNLEKIKAEIAKRVEVKDTKLEPLAFGLKALIVLVIANDVGNEAIEAKIRSVPGIADVTVESVTLI
jgi:elongation factor 1-beta